MDTSIVVDKSRGQALTVWLNVSFPRVPCYRAFLRTSTAINIYTSIVLSLDVMDVSGELQRDITHQIVKVRLDQGGKQIPNSQSADPRNDLDRLNEQRGSSYCGSCYGGLTNNPGGCCNSCDEVRQAYINRGWSFNSPDDISQVHSLAYTLRQCLFLTGWTSVLRRVGRKG